LNIFARLKFAFTNLFHRLSSRRLPVQQRQLVFGAVALSAKAFFYIGFLNSLENHYTHLLASEFVK
jgi:hypothetical protein